MRRASTPRADRSSPDNQSAPEVREDIQYLREQTAMEQADSIVTQQGGPGCHAPRQDFQRGAGLPRPRQDFPRGARLPALFVNCRKDCKPRYRSAGNSIVGTQRLQLVVRGNARHRHEPCECNGQHAGGNELSVPNYHRGVF